MDIKQELIVLVNMANHIKKASDNTRLTLVNGYLKSYNSDEITKSKEILTLKFRINKLDVIANNSDEKLEKKMKLKEIISKLPVDNSSLSLNVELPTTANELMLMIFTSFLKHTIFTELRDYEKTRNFNSQSILDNAISNFKEWMNFEALLQFECICLAERFEQIYAAHTHTPEREAIVHTLEHKNPFEFKLDATRELYKRLDPAITDDSLSEIKRFNTDCGNKLIYEQVTAADINVNLYFNTDAYYRTSVSGYLKGINQELKEIVENSKSIFTQINSTEDTHFTGLTATTDLDLEKLRSVINEYYRVLESIGSNEKQFYKNRSAESLKNRKEYIEELRDHVNEAKSLTLEVKKVVVNYITDIHNTSPTWKELHWIDKILDIITFGYMAYRRATLFKPHDAEKALYSKQDSYIQPDKSWALNRMPGIV